MANWWEKCQYCTYFHYIKTKKYDCCDVDLYKCDITGKVIDEFHIERMKLCNKFNEQDWISG